MRVRTVFQPTEEIEVSEQEAQVLRHQGLLVEDEAPGEQGDAAEQKPPAKPAPGAADQGAAKSAAAAAAKEA